MKDSYIDWLESQIDHHQREVAKFTIARDVYLEAPKAQKVTPAKAKSPVKRNTKQAPEVRENILSALRHLDRPATSREIIEAMLQPFPDKTIWNNLYQLQRKNIVLKDGQFYSMVQP